MPQEQQQEQQQRPYQQINDFPTNYLKNGENSSVKSHANAEFQEKSAYEVSEIQI